MRQMSKCLITLVLLSLMSSIASGQRSPDGAWTSISAAALDTNQARGAKAWVRPDRFSAFELDPLGLAVLLAASPREFTAAAIQAPAVLTLPRPDGTFERFAVVESRVMHPDLEQRMADEGFPMKTYSGTGLDNPGNTLRFDWGGPAGFHAMVHSPYGDYFIDPYWQGDTRLYTSYFRRDYTLNGQGKTFLCEVEPGPGPLAGAAAPPSGLSSAAVSTGGLLRTYRMAMAGTGEYTTFHGGTAAAGQAAVTTTVNRINMVYERDFSLRMVLVANNMNLIHTNAATDPYSNGSCSTMLGQNQISIDALIGSANYDIGHVSGTGGGGVASLGSPCNASFKARGCTGRNSPVGDPFDIDFVAHEVGHQWGGRHTWSGSGGSCTVSNFAPSAAYEPGSGSTIQAYAGICGASENLQSNSDDYFHRKSLDEMGAFINGAGSCSSTGAVINPNEPTADAGADFTIPMGTPFELTGGGSDADGDPTTFNWEQFDLGLRMPLATGDDGVQPIFRSWPSTSSPTRVFPRIADLVLGTMSPGETLPVTDRTMNFKLTVRDNRPGGGREKDDAMMVTSTTTAGPFGVTAPNGGENFAAGSGQTVTWSVASTSGGLVNTPNVDILLSTDGGLTYPTTLLSNTPNDGSESVTMPTNVSTTAGRVKVKGASNIFFDISDSNFLIGALSQCRSPALPLADPGSVSDQMTITGGMNLADLNLKLDIAHTWVGDLIVTLEHVDTATSVTLIDQPGVPATPQGCANNNIIADLDDEAATAVEGQCSGTPPAISGTFSPNNPLAAFDGQDVGGAWKLTVTDTFNQDSGTLNMWCLGGSFEVSACPADLVLANQTLTGTQTLEATASATLGPSLVVDGVDIAVNAPILSIFGDTEISGIFSLGANPSCP